MRFSEFWSRGTAEATGRDGGRIAFSCWRSSDKSKDDAQAAALAAAQRAAERLASGEPLARYGYGDQPLREELIQQIRDDQGRQQLVVTRNSYGALVLNTADVMFLDIDFPASPPGNPLGWLLGKLTGRKTSSPGEQHETQARGALAAWATERKEFGLRVYRTHSGLRGLVTHALFDPNAPETTDLLDSCGCDPLYARLCRGQQCFRARLTPKPYRCGLKAPSTSWPRQRQADHQQFEAWLKVYDARQAGFATCRYLETLGRPAILPAVQPIVDLHDHFTRATQPLELA